MKGGYVDPNYVPPPEDFVQPSRCEKCGGTIIIVLVEDGRKRWIHVVPADHEVQIGQWWDVSGGKFKSGPTG